MFPAQLGERAAQMRKNRSDCKLRSSSAQNRRVTDNSFKGPAPRARCMYTDSAGSTWPTEAFPPRTACSLPEARSLREEWLVLALRSGRARAQQGAKRPWRRVGKKCYFKLPRSADSKGVHTRSCEGRPKWRVQEPRSPLPPPYDRFARLCKVASGVDADGGSECVQLGASLRSNRGLRPPLRNPDQRFSGVCTEAAGDDAPRSGLNAAFYIGTPLFVFVSKILFRFAV